MTSVGAVKTALHRGRKRLEKVKDLDEVATGSVSRRTASPVLLDRFVERLNASDLPSLPGLMLDTATVEEVGNLLEVGRQQFQKKGSWLWHAVNVHPDLPPDLRRPKYVNERANPRTRLKWAGCYHQSMRDAGVCEHCGKVGAPRLVDPLNLGRAC